MVGAPEHALTEARIPYETGVARYREIARGQIVGDDSGFFKMIFHRDDRRLLGVHIMGTGATELIHIGQAVLALGGRPRLLPGHRLQLPHLGRVLQGGGPERGQQAGLTARSARRPHARNTFDTIM